MKIYKYCVDDAFNGTYAQILFNYDDYGAEILDVQQQEGSWYVWIKHNPGGTFEGECKIFVYGTGQEMPADSLMEHISTVQEGKFVWHFFQVTT